MHEVQSIVFTVLTLAGALGIFLYGMKLMSEGLQKVAGDRMRSMLTAMTNTRFRGIMTGIVVTAVIQSSSATTVMVVSFVNAGLLNLIQAAGVIMGANVGTTATAWLISLLGFKFDISMLSLPLIGLSLPFLFNKKAGRKSFGELLLGFSLIFLGLAFLKESVPDLSQHPKVLEYIASYSNMGIWSVLLFVFAGLVLTVLVQSSSASLALTLVMCTNGWIGFTMAAAMILGENLGTTITAIIAASVGNLSAKRAALFHLIFNLVGVLWVLAIFSPFLRVTSHLTQLSGVASPLTNPSSIPFALSLFHTVFNVANLLFMVWFTLQLVNLVKRLMPRKDNEDEEFRLRHINIGLLNTGELSLVQAKKETIAYANRTYRMFGFVRSMMDAPNEKELRKIYERIMKYEVISDRVEVEIAKYLGQIHSADLSEEGNELLQALFKIIDDIESIADYCHNAAKILLRKQQEGIWFNENTQTNIERMLDLVDDAFLLMRHNLEGNYDEPRLEEAKECEKRINQFRNRLKAEHVKNVESSVYSYQTGIFYNDILSQLERMGDNIINISEDIAEIRNPESAFDEEVLAAARGQ